MLIAIVRCPTGGGVIVRERTATYIIVAINYDSGFQTGVRGPKGVRDGFPRGPREDSEK